MAPLFLFAVGTGNPAAAYAADGARQLVYQVQHSVFGDIGTYTNQIQKSGPAMTVNRRTDLWPGLFCGHRELCQ